MTSVSRKERKIAIISGVLKPAEDILLLGLLNVICGGFFSVHPFSRHVNDACHSNTEEENTAGDKN